MKAFNPKTVSTMALTLAFLASVSIRCLDAIPAFAEAPATSQPVRAYSIGRRGRG